MTDTIVRTGGLMTEGQRVVRGKLKKMYSHQCLDIYTEIEGNKFQFVERIHRGDFVFALPSDFEDQTRADCMANTHWLLVFQVRQILSETPERLRGSVSDSAIFIGRFCRRYEDLEGRFKLIDDTKVNTCDFVMSRFHSDQPIDSIVGKCHMQIGEGDDGDEAAFRLSVVADGADEFLELRDGRHVGRLHSVMNFLQDPVPFQETEKMTQVPHDQLDSSDERVKKRKLAAKDEPFVGRLDVKSAEWHELKPQLAEWIRNEMNTLSSDTLRQCFGTADLCRRRLERAKTLNGEFGEFVTSVFEENEELAARVCARCPREMRPLVHAAYLWVEAFAQAELLWTFANFGLKPVKLSTRDLAAELRIETKIKNDFDTRSSQQQRTVCPSLRARLRSHRKESC